jgi:CMP-N-acetylneuraminic acid synthetase
MIKKQIQEMIEIFLGNNYKFLFTNSMVEIEPLSLNDQNKMGNNQ